ncbi:hypothetical protein I4U23_030742 [Adineta vaga]|nr:hypothetical protein I4U23_030742 [Adineta vaga]
MASSKNQTCSTLVHNVCSLLKSSEKDRSISFDTLSSNETKTKEELKNKLIASSDISSSDNEEKERRKMGNKMLKHKKKVADLTELSDQQIELLVSTTKFSAQQIREWHQSFIRDHPSGKLDRKQFIEVYQQFYPQGKANAFCELAFKVFDHDKNGFVDFQEFLTTISMTMSGNIEDRLNLAFAMYDINEDGLLDKKEMSLNDMIFLKTNISKNIYFLFSSNS